MLKNVNIFREIVKVIGMSCRPLKSQQIRKPQRVSTPRMSFRRRSRFLLFSISVLNHKNVVKKPYVIVWYGTVFIFIQTIFSGTNVHSYLVFVVVNSIFPLLFFRMLNSIVLFQQKKHSLLTIKVKCASVTDLNSSSVL